ncbi:MAG: GTP-binding protein [Promethearchaeota archaeon]|jgi:small GTP-binding protein|nr:MAG: GTP-binding protein [Candidatus Lokiarchaeota archaeon]
MYDAIFKVIIFGDAGSGKTTLLRRYVTDLFISDTQMTIGVDFEIKTIVIDGKTIKLQIWDFGGEERFRFLLPKYIRGASGGIFMYDITNYSSLAHVDDWLSVVEEVEEEFPIILIGGKSDLVQERRVSKEEGIKIAKSRKLNTLIECSSKTGENIELIFNTIAKLMLNRFD